MIINKNPYSLLRQYKQLDYNEYLHKVFEDYQIIKFHYPLLNLTILPTYKPYEVCITGKLIPSKILDLCHNSNLLDENSIDIFAIFPEKYPHAQIKVKDLKNKILWNNIPYKHWHLNEWRNSKFLCTHHPDGEINFHPTNKKSVKILKSAWQLYSQCNMYIKGEPWRLRELRHGGAAIQQLKASGDYHAR